jgi:hypothetical protein
VLCEKCHGKRLVVQDGEVRPCEECGGFGEVHCCEGLQAQPCPPDPAAAGPGPDGAVPQSSAPEKPPTTPPSQPSQMLK